MMLAQSRGRLVDGCENFSRSGLKTEFWNWKVKTELFQMWASKNRLFTKQTERQTSYFLIRESHHGHTTPHQHRFLHDCIKRSSVELRQIAATSTTLLAADCRPWVAGTRHGTRGEWQPAGWQRRAPMVQPNVAELSRTRVESTGGLRGLQAGGRTRAGVFSVSVFVATFGVFVLLICSSWTLARPPEDAVWCVIIHDLW